jgi:hypothetical protein
VPWPPAQVVADEVTKTLSRNHSKTFNQTMSTGRVQPQLLPALQHAILSAASCVSIRQARCRSILL